MKIYLLGLITLLVFISRANAQDSELTKKAQREYLKKVKDVERSMKKRKIKSEDLNIIVPFLEKLTGVNSYVHVEESYMSFSFILPNKYNIQDWKDWYNLNKDIIIWDSSTKEICFLEFPKNIKKDPVVEYEKYLAIIDLDYSSDYVVSEDLFDYAYSFLESLTNYEVDYNGDYGFKYPTPNDILFYKNWLQKSKENLYWNSSIQKVELKR